MEKMWTTGRSRDTGIKIFNRLTDKILSFNNDPGKFKETLKIIKRKQRLLDANYTGYVDFWGQNPAGL